MQRLSGQRFSQVTKVHRRELKLVDWQLRGSRPRSFLANGGLVTIERLSWRFDVQGDPS